MIRIGPTLALLLTSTLATGCMYDLSVAGKACDEENPCPSGYTCTSGADGRVCTKGPADGGPDDGDGSDGGDDATCTEGQTRCSPDLTAIQTCTGGGWQDQACGQDEYCLDTDQAAPACEQPCPTSACPGGTWCNPATSHCEPRGDCTQPGVDRCNPSLDEVIRCDPDSGLDVTVAACTADQYCDPFDPACKDYCDDDTGCEAPDTTCEPSSRKCVPVGLCAENADCEDGAICVGGACVAPPDTEGVVLVDQSPELACYVGDPAQPPDSPTSCQLTGRVVDFFTRQYKPESLGLIVRAHLLDDVLAGRLDAPLVSTAVVADGASAAKYTFASVPTNTKLVLEVQGSPDVGEGFKTLFTFGLFIRAEECSDGSYSFSAPVLVQNFYEGYSNPPGIFADPNRGLLFGQLRDCADERIRYGTGGLSMEAERVYYLNRLNEDNAPDMDATRTNASGFFVAVNVLPIRGVAAALVLDQGVPVSLRPRPVRVFPGTASLVVFGRPLDPDGP